MFGLGRQSVFLVIQQQNAEELPGLHASPERNGFVLYIQKGGCQDSGERNPLTPSHMRHTTCPDSLQGKRSALHVSSSLCDLR